ncbi:hypothetical protein P9112_000739 [Eukaryota sp. TZLM1-RC]
MLQFVNVERMSLQPIYLIEIVLLLLDQKCIMSCVISSIVCLSLRKLNFLEPLLSNLADKADRISFGDSRGGVLVSGLDGSIIIIGDISTDVSNSSNEKLAPSYNSVHKILAVHAILTTLSLTASCNKER